MSILSHRVSSANIHDDRDTFRAAREAGVANPDDPDGYMACANELCCLPSEAEFTAWLSGVYPVRDVYLDECEEMPFSHFFEPDEDDRLAAMAILDRPFFDGPLFAPDRDDLAWLESQRADCLDLPETLANLDREIGELRAALERGD